MGERMNEIFKERLGLFFLKLELRSIFVGNYFR